MQHFRLHYTAICVKEVAAGACEAKFRQLSCHQFKCRAYAGYGEVMPRFRCSENYEERNGTESVNNYSAFAFAFALVFAGVPILS
jgi:hypothetical protein